MCFFSYFEWLVYEFMIACNLVVLFILIVFFGISGELLQDKLQSLARKHSNVIDSLSPNVRMHVEFLKEVQVQLYFQIVYYIYFMILLVCIGEYSILVRITFLQDYDYPKRME